MTSGTKTPESDKESTLHGSEDEAITALDAYNFNKSKLTDNIAFPCLPQLFGDAVAKHPSKPAVICGDKMLTYTELNTLIDRFTHGLTQHGVRPGDIVGVALSRSVELVSLILAVTNSGAVYLPIDPSFPLERIRGMVEDACPKIVVTDADSALSSLLSTTASVPLVSVTDLLPSSPYPNLTKSSPCTPTSIAYLIYTSGSTGSPKGVLITHSSLSNLLVSMLSTPGLSSEDTLLAVTTISFDMAIPELFLPLVAGGTVVVARQEEVKDMAAVVELIRRWGISVVQATPVWWGMMMEYLGDDQSLDLRQIWTGGEALSVDLATKMARHVVGDDKGGAVWNLYGPTETTVYAAMWRVRPDESIKVGKAVDGLVLHVIDTSGKDEHGPVLVTLGEVGELCVGGKGVAKGYHNRPELTQDKFVRDPWSDGFMYRTGDSARIDPLTGEVSVLGRMDGQVKIRGYRIEVGEVEAAILQHDQVSGIVVVARDERLVAYCVRRPVDDIAGSVGDGTQQPLAGLLRPFLAARLPAYMVPAFFVEVNTFPTTLNGKIDRKALPDPVTSLSSPANSSKLSITDLERHILAIWSSALGHGRIDVMDNFFEIGGDSSRIVRVQKELEILLKRPISVAKLFEHFTIKSLSKHLASDISVPPLTPLLPTQPVPSVSNQDIAIISMSCRLPGGVSTPEEFWTLLSSGGDAITDVPPGRWESPSPPKSAYPRRGGFLSSITSFDASFFGISPREARALDPAHYLMLEVVHEAFERASYIFPSERPEPVGVFMGVSNNLPSFTPPGLTTPPVGQNGNENEGGYNITGSAPATLSGRISHHFNLTGPTLTIDTACSSSLVATHLACKSLQNAECTLALAGGVSIMLHPGLQAEFTRLGGTSPDGQCRAFSADSEGTGFSEGCAVVLLKRLDDAERDGDAIHAVIRGSAVNHDGKSASLTTPNGAAQTRLVRTALERAGVAPMDVDYVEAHGTGTRLGDPIEALALGEVFEGDDKREGNVWVGSVKSNIGHTQAAAGLAGLLKVVLAMEHGTLPASIHISKPTEKVDWDRLGIQPLTRKMAWPAAAHNSGKKKKRVAGVSAFGIGGTNAHVIVGGGPRIRTGDHVAETMTASTKAMPFLLSADTDAALGGQLENFRQYLNPTGVGAGLPLDDIAYSLATTRHHYRKRLLLVAKDRTELLERVSSSILSALGAPPPPTTPEIPKLAMLFTGQGSQYSNMGQDLDKIYPIFHSAVREIAAHFDSLKVLPTSLLDVMWPSPSASNAQTASLLNRTDYAQPALFTLEVSLWRLWKSWGVTPDFIMGHSLGELAAAHVAGILDISDACRLVAARSRLMQAQADENYCMLSIEAGGAEVEAAVEQLGCDDVVDIAAYNTTAQTVISGLTNAVETVDRYFSEQQNRKTKIILAGNAFHSRLMDKMLSDFRGVAETVQFYPPRIQIISSVDGKPVKGGRMQNAQYWVDQVRKPVYFANGIETLVKQLGVNFVVEIGPHPVLCGMGAACLSGSNSGSGIEGRDSAVEWLPSLFRSRNGVQSLLQSLACLHTRHAADIDWREYFAPFPCRRVPLPTYAFQRTFHQHHLRAPPGSITGNPLEGRGQRQNEGGVGHLEFEISWIPVHVPKTETPNGEKWGIISPSRSTWTRKVEVILESAGVELIKLADLVDLTTSAVNRIACLWDRDEEDVMLGSQALVAKALAQLQFAASSQLKQPLIWVTRHATGTGNDDKDMIPGPGSLLWGLMRTARSEHSELSLRLVDMDDSDHVSREAVSSAMLLDSEPECAVRHNQVLAARMQHVSPPHIKSLGADSLVRSDGVVLVTGGTGYLGAHASRWLVQKHRIRNLILTSRQGLETSEAKKLVAELSAMGANVTVVSSDIADPDSVASLIASLTPERPLRGILHAAGISDSGVLSSLTAERCQNTVAPKAYGAWLLHEATKHMDLDFFVMFSSISGVLGMPGLANYAAANTFLDALAHFRQGQGLPATSVAYGTWAGDGGMAARLGEGARSHLGRFGLDAVLPDEGLMLLSRAITSRRPLTVAAGLHLERVRNFYRDQGERLPILLRSLIAEETPFLPAANNPGQKLKDRLSGVKVTEGSRVVLEMVREVAAKALGYVKPLDIDVDRPLRDIGIDSLTAVQMRNHLGALTGLSLSVNIALVHPNLRALSAALLVQLRDEEVLSSSQASSLLCSQLDINAICNGSLDRTITFDYPPLAPSDVKSVLLTGATGFVGAFILHALLQRRVIVHCLVRATDNITARDRICSALESYSLSPSNEQLIIPVAGDVSEPRFGLTEQTFSQLATQIDAICHAAGLVDWMRPFSEYIGPNVVSTHEILRLASSCSAKKSIPIHLISTISTLPFHAGNPPFKDTDPEHGYGTSKYLAERLVACARWRGAHATVYRLPYVTASTATGAFRSDKGDFLHNLISGGLLELGCFPVISSKNGGDMGIVLPVDYLAETVVAVMLGEQEGKGETWDFRNDNAAGCNEFLEMAAKVGASEAGLGVGGEIKMMRFGEWKKRALEYAALHPQSRIARIAAVLDGYTEETADAMFRGERVGNRVFGGKARPAPVLDRRWMTQYLHAILERSGK